MCLYRLLLQINFLKCEIFLCLKLEEILNPLRENMNTALTVLTQNKFLTKNFLFTQSVQSNTCTWHTKNKTELEFLKLLLCEDVISVIVAIMFR